jgi:DNA polymerase III epsilon subunit-like protein
MQPYVALDCEMVGIGRTSVLAEVAVVDWNGKLIYHSYVSPPRGKTVTDYRTEVSGITKEVLDKKGRSFLTVRNEVMNLLDGKILVGHALENDLKALGISVPPEMRRNTAHLPDFQTLHKRGMLNPQSLKSLAKQYLGINIQAAEHDPAVDARTAMKLFRTFAELWETPTRPIGPVYAVPTKSASIVDVGAGGGGTGNAVDAVIPGPNKEIFIPLAYIAASNSNDLDMVQGIRERQSKRMGIPLEEVVLQDNTICWKRSLTTLILPSGSDLYRHDREGARSPSDQLPAFFGDPITTKPFARNNPAAMSAYKTTRDAVLLNLTLDNLWMVAQSLDGDDEELMAQYLHQEADGRYVVIPTLPIGYPGPSGHIPYLNRKIADIVCSLGLDGWVAKRYNREKREGLRQMSLLTGAVTEYPPEIMLCRWTDVAERVPVPVGGNRSRTYRRRRGTLKRKTPRSRK